MTCIAQQKLHDDVLAAYRGRAAKRLQLPHFESLNHFSAVACFHISCGSGSLLARSIIAGPCAFTKG
jgi:hypothetical protein